MKKLIAIILSASLLSACGWHLRGSLSLPAGIDSIYVAEANSNRVSSGTIADTIRKTLRQSDINVSDSAADAQYVISLSNERQDRRAISIGSGSLASEYELTHEIDYTIADAEGNILSPKTTGRVIRSYDYDRNDVAAKEEEENILRKEMRNNLASQILNRIRFLAPAPAATSEPSTATDASTAAPAQ